jgi:hypothetical protein
VEIIVAQSVPLAFVVDVVFDRYILRLPVTAELVPTLYINPKLVNVVLLGIPAVSSEARAIDDPLK